MKSTLREWQKCVKWHIKNIKQKYVAQKVVKKLCLIWYLYMHSYTNSKQQKSSRIPASHGSITAEKTWLKSAKYIFLPTHFIMQLSFLAYICLQRFQCNCGLLDGNILLQTYDAFYNNSILWKKGITNWLKPKSNAISVFQTLSNLKDSFFSLFVT